MREVKHTKGLEYYTMSGLEYVGQYYLNPENNIAYVYDDMKVNTKILIPRHTFNTETIRLRSITKGGYEAPVPIKVKPTDLEYDKKIYFSNENGEICTFDKKIKISNHPIVDFDIKHNVIIAVSKNELFILRKSNLTLLKKYELNETIFEVASNGEDIIICTDNKLLIFSDEKFYSILENIEFNSRAIYINKGIIYVGSINGLYTINDQNLIRNNAINWLKNQYYFNDIFAPSVI